MYKIDSILYFIFNFFIYGFLGWIIENAYSYFIKGHLQEEGFLNSPFKPMYAIAMSLLVLISQSFNFNTYQLVIWCFIVPTTVEYITGLLMRTYFNKDYWDYSTLKYNFKGIICLKFSIYWTILTYVGIRYFQINVVNKLYNMSSVAWGILCPILIIVLVIDDILTIKQFIVKSNAADG